LIACDNSDGTRFLFRVVTSIGADQRRKVADGLLDAFLPSAVILFNPQTLA
jgi:hypothetical protein